MEIRNTATEKDLEWLDTPELVSQLKIALRNVAVHECYLPTPSKSMVLWIEMVQKIYRLLATRGIDLVADLMTLSTETGWLIRPLLEECLQWPTITPHVRESDGIRRHQRCWNCKKREYPEDSVEKLCDGCIVVLIDQIRQRTPPDGVILFRTYNSSRWCTHADAETVLMTLDEYDFLADGRCELCLEEEYQRRHRPKE